ncbi:hypothetical protein KAFR_0B02900 [Kazachstania africana CBS 2517]|uniref:Long chronological lifespan protein 2 n=1 Tax=Kazachstania africana (strain ATCC 22294 / BCRC 22015 / CBS 2517 / CECT 1963 / NBRC 1671 / NRRL Y-8276) TaxID=1071382 RepID=H2AQD7_KAZAF|nr:hypothetical protein KAFR_0B02900 [Kazachstania africana CBS 2517]CCF56587.1 hypothetical protein KAFR_0B02900 [Kazachstania africana CBS 2517]
MLHITFTVCVFLHVLAVHGFIFNFNQNQHQQQQAQESFEDRVLNNNCPDYLCPDTLECVKSAIDCPCPYPKSQLKCILPHQDNYICISKPAIHDVKINAIYDDPVRGPKAHNKGLRDCGWVNDVFQGNM